MPTLAQKPAPTPIPVHLAHTECHECLFPPLSLPPRGPKGTLGSHRLFTLLVWVLSTAMQWQCRPVPTDRDGHPALHDTTVSQAFATWSDDGSLAPAFIASVGPLAAQHGLERSVLHGDGTNTVAKKGGDGLGSSGHTPQQGEHVLALIANNGYGLAPLPVAPVHAAATVLWPAGLKGVQRGATRTGLERAGASLPLDGGCDSARHRKAICTAGLLPNI